MKKIAVLTSGGDAPGMNAAIRAVTRTGLERDWQVFGVQRGYQGAIDDDIIRLGPRDVGGIIQRGGTVLGSARCPDFKTISGRHTALANFEKRGIEALVVIGGNGSQTGANALHEMGFPVVGVASTIDNDLYGSDITIGVDTALDIALEAIDRLKTTASSHRRAFLVEVMGRDCGYLALMSGIAGGAEAIVIPEMETSPEELADVIGKSYERGKAHTLIVVAEGATYNAEALVNYFREHKERLGYGIRATQLGHVQRGGAPGAYDRVLATRLGAGAVEQIEKGNYGVLVGMLKSEVTTTPLEEVVKSRKGLDMELYGLSKVLARH